MWQSINQCVCRQPCLFALFVCDCSSASFWFEKGLISHKGLLYTGIWAGNENCLDPYRSAVLSAPCTCKQFKHTVNESITDYTFKQKWAWSLCCVISVTETPQRVKIQVQHCQRKTPRHTSVHMITVSEEQTRSCLSCCGCVAVLCRCGTWLHRGVRGSEVVLKRRSSPSQHGPFFTLTLGDVLPVFLK